MIARCINFALGLEAVVGFSLQHDPTLQQVASRHKDSAKDHTSNAVRRKRDEAKHALILFGAVARLSHQKPSSIGDASDIYDVSLGPYTPVNITGAGIIRHILDQNPNMDVIMHSWNLDLKDELEEVFNPVRAEFEDNRDMEEIFKGFESSDWKQVSCAYSLKQGVKLMQEQEEISGMQYDSVIFYRPDVILLKDLKIDVILNDTAKVYVNSHVNGNGDFHFIMTRANAIEFAKLYDSISALHPANPPHGWIQFYINHEMETSVVMDGVVPGVDEEIYRKIPYTREPEHFCDELVALGFAKANTEYLNITCEL